MDSAKSVEPQKPKSLPESFLERAFLAVDDVLAFVRNLMGRSMGSHCTLIGVEGEDVLVDAGGGLVTLLELKGMRVMPGDREFEQALERIQILFQSVLQTPGHEIEFVFHRDPEFAWREIERATRPAAATLQRLGLDAMDVLEDRRQALARYCVFERCWIVCRTRADVLTRYERKKAIQQRARRMAEHAQGGGSLVFQAEMPGLEIPHRALVSALISGLENLGITARKLSVREALFELRRLAEPHHTADDWQPVLPDSHYWATAPRYAQENASAVLPPSLSSQLFPRGGVRHGRLFIQGGRVYGTVMMTVGPQKTRSFQVLLNAIVAAGIPFRASLRISAEGLARTVLKEMLASIFYLGANRLIVKAMKELREYVDHGGLVCGFNATFCTWADFDPGAPENGISLAENRTAQLARAVQSWGACDTTDQAGDPLYAWSSTLPAVTGSSPAETMAAPLHEAVRLLPLFRPSMPWETGSLLLRSPDGRLLPYEPGSKLQAYWVELGFAPMGYGKSVLLNTINWAMCLAGGIERLPWLRILDIGPSSSGLISLVRGALPADKQYLAVHHRLRQDRSSAINPFDLPLGAYRPTPYQFDFLVNFLTLLCTPIGEDAPHQDVPAIVQMIINRAYEYYGPEKNPKIYSPNLDAGVAAAVEECGIHYDSATTWWDVAHKLFAANRVHEAVLAQRHAVPLLAEVAALAQESEVTSIFGGVTSTQEKVTQFVWRVLAQDSLHRFPVLSAPTQFDLGEARIVSLDLDEVAPRGTAEAEYRTGVMYMLANYVLCRDMYMSEEDLSLFQEPFLSWHRRRVRDMRSDPKRICMDEYHRVPKTGPVRAQTIINIREGRKRNVHVALYSQNVKDFDDVVVDLASCIYILGAGSEAVADELQERFRLSTGAHDALRYRIHKPKSGGSGSSMIAIFKTEMGTLQQLVMNTIGPIEAWAFNTNAEDALLRDMLYEQLQDPAEARRRLAKRFPSGSAATEIARRKAAMGTVDQYEASANVLMELLAELMRD